jgi:hypothetical protein
MQFLNELEVSCPYCGEAISLLVDGSIENSSYIEDCSVCCQPMLVHVQVDVDGEIQLLQVRREDETG